MMVWLVMSLWALYDRFALQRIMWRCSVICGFPPPFFFIVAVIGTYSMEYSSAVIPIGQANWGIIVGLVENFGWHHCVRSVSCFWLQTANGMVVGPTL